VGLANTEIILVLCHFSYASVGGGTPPEDLRNDQAFSNFGSRVGDAGGGAATLKTMTPAMFTDTVKTMRPKIVFPYNYGNNDPKTLADLLKGENAIEVRVRDIK
jgi:hypothetical protein